MDTSWYTCIETYRQPEVVSRRLNKSIVVYYNVSTNVFCTHALCGFALRNNLLVFVAMTSVH